MFASQIAAPVVVLIYAALFYETLKPVPVWHLLLMIGAYVGMPLVVAKYLLTKSQWFIYVVMGQCLLLLGMAFLPATQVPDFLFFTHYTLVITMVVMALMMINRDLLFPFIFEEKRGFRREPRVEINHPVKLIHPDGKSVFNLLIDDCSLSGLAIYGNADELEKILPLLKRDSEMYLHSTVRKKKFKLSLSYQWQSVSSQVVKLGFRANDMEMMSGFFQALGPKASRHGSRVRFRQIWAKKPARRLINYVFAFAMLTMMTLPPLLVPENRAAVSSKIERIGLLKDKFFGNRKTVGDKKKPGKKIPKEALSH